MPAPAHEPAADAPAVDVGELLARIEAGDPVLLLDVRNADEFGQWRFEGRRPVETLHIPYFGSTRSGTATRCGSAGRRAEGSGSASWRPRGTPPDRART